MSGPARESGQVNAWLELVAVLTCVALVLTALRPGLAVSLVILKTPLKSMCRALRVPLMSRAGRADVNVQVHATRIICLPPSGRLCRPCSPSPAAACRGIGACQTPFSPPLSGDVRPNRGNSAKDGKDGLR